VDPGRALLCGLKKRRERERERSSSFGINSIKMNV
jgi:hypothetical protein